jgi:N-acetylmuramic acid 6-phosphate (MurNAc-6-P) etherase
MAKRPPVSTQIDTTSLNNLIRRLNDSHNSLENAIAEVLQDVQGRVSHQLLAGQCLRFLQYEFDGTGSVEYKILVKKVMGIIAGE